MGGCWGCCGDADACDFLFFDLLTGPPGLTRAADQNSGPAYRGLLVIEKCIAPSIRFQLQLNAALFLVISDIGD